MTADVFISYRREDTEMVASAIYVHLARVLGDGAVFLDAHSIPGAVNFVEYLQESVQRAALVIAVMGPRWGPRLRDDSDYVRMEMETALRLGVPVLPVFVEGITTVPAQHLPGSLRALAHQNGIRLRPGRELAEDLRRLEAEVARARNAPVRLVEQGLEAHRDGRMDEAARLFQRAAEQGDARGQYYLGACRAVGAGVGRNLQDAFEWYRRSADQGWPAAQYALAQAYEQGAGTSPDREEAEYWYRKAAEQGDPDAMAALPRFDAARAPAELGADALFARAEQAFDDGFYDAAAALLKKAGDLGRHDAFAILGLLYDPNLGTAFRPEPFTQRRRKELAAESIRYYRLAARHGALPAEGYFGFAMALDDGPIDRDSGGEMVDAYKRAAAAGLKGAMHRLGEIYMGGEVVPQDWSEAARWFGLAAERGVTKAQELLAVFYAFGTGVRQDFGEAERWARKAGDDNAFLHLLRSPLKRLSMKMAGPAGALEHIQEILFRERLAL